MESPPSTGLGDRLGSAQGAVSFCDWAGTCNRTVSCREKLLCSAILPPNSFPKIACSRHESTPVGFEPTRGDPIGLAGRRRSPSAKVSSARATGLSHLSSQKGSDLGQETFFLDQWSLWVSVCGVVDLEVKLGVRCRATHRSGLIHVSLILDNVCIADARFAGFPSGIIR